MNKKHLGIFLQCTDSYLKLKITKNNYDKLYSNFDFIVIDDIENNEYSDEFQNHIKSNVECISILHSDINSNSNDDFDVTRILKIMNYNEIDYTKYDYITFINNNYIYCDSLIDYFKYVQNHNCDFYAYSDSSENTYHYQLYLFTFHTKILSHFVNILKKKKNVAFTLPTHIEKKMVYLKVAYVEENMFKNIFFNEIFYEYLVKNNFLKIINIHKLNLFVYQDSSKYLFPVYIRDLLKNAGLLSYYDVPDNFNLYQYRKNNMDLEKMSNKELLLHWIHNGSKENRSYIASL